MNYLLSFVFFAYYELIVLAPDFFRSTIGHILWPKPVVFFVGPVFVAILTYALSRNSKHRLLERIIPAVLLLLVPIPSYYLHDESWTLFVLGLSHVAIISYFVGMLLCWGIWYFATAKQNSKDSG